MPSTAPETPTHDAADRALGLPRTVADLGVALSYTVHELPHLVQDLRELVRQLTRAAYPGNELMRLLDGLAQLAHARADRERAEVARPELERSAA